MGEAKFTKGPWVSGMQDISDAEEYNVECDFDCGWSYIGTSKKCIAMAVTKSHSDIELDANTALIAAAPEMYEMLESARNELYALIDEVNDQRASRITSTTETEPDYHDQETLYLIDKLLAKARGES